MKINPYNDESHNYELCKEKIEEIDLELFEQACLLAINGGMDSLAPLGFSSKDIVLYGYFIPSKKSEDENWHRVSMVQIRIWNNLLDFMMTDKEGEWLVHIQTQRDNMKFLYDTFLKYKDEVDKEHNFEEIDLKITENTTFSLSKEKILKRSNVEEETKC